MPKMRRAPAGARGSIPVDTLLSADPNGVFVETPIVGTLVQGSSGWSKSVSVHARKLIDLCDTIRKIKKISNKKKIDPSEMVAIGISSAEFFIKYENTQLSLPLMQK